MHGWETAALNHISNVAAQVGINNLRAGNAEHGTHLLLRHVAQFKYAGLFGFNQEHGFVTDLGLHSGSHADLKQAFGHRRRINTQLDIYCRLVLIQQDFRGIGLLKRHVLQVDALDLENGVKIGFGHGQLSVLF